ncbi:MAG: TolC family protein, partial [bacterium]|nr:TolC family protein [bacterium]
SCAISRRSKCQCRIAALSIVLCAGTLAFQTGCQTYERKPLDMESLGSAVLARSPGDQSVRDFSITLSAAETGASSVFDPSDGLTLMEAEPVTLVFNPDLRLARLEANVTRATAEHAGLWQDPVLGADVERIVSGAGGDNPWVLGSTLSITIPISGRLEAEKARAGAAFSAELDRVAAKEWATRAALRELWIEWSAQRLRIEIADELVARLRDVASLAGQQEKSGSMSRIDSRLFRVELAGRESDHVALTARLKELELQLRAMMGLAPTVDLVLVPTLAFTPRATDGQELSRALELTNPELAVVRSEYEVAEQSLRTEVRKQYPDLTIGPGYGTDQGDDRVLVGLTLPIPLWNRNKQGVAEATAQREVARGRFESTYEQLASRLAIAFVRYESGKAQRAMIESSVVPLADEQEADVRRVAALGRVDPLLLLESLQTLHAAKLRLIDARASEAIGAIRVDELIGPPIHLLSAAGTDSQTPAADSPAPVEGHRP